MDLNLTLNRKYFSYDEIDMAAVIKGAGFCSYAPGNPGRKARKKIVNLTCAFDIETTRMEEYDISFIYIWQFQVGEEITIIGRTVEDLIEFFTRLSAAIPRNSLLPVWVFNLSFEFQYLQGIFSFNTDDVFCVERRKILKATLFNSIEFRCAYLHSNMSLAVYTNKMGVTVQKITGVFDYKKLRFPWTPLTDIETAYCMADVISLVLAINREMEIDGDTLSTIPLTSTGYVRRRVKNALLQNRYYQFNLQKILPDYVTYIALREAFRGGNTHGNRAYVGTILEGVQSVDRSSSYPDVMVNQKFPMGRFENYGPISRERVDKMIFTRKKAALLRVSFFNLVLKNEFDGCPYLSKDKASICIKPMCDNGRILRAVYYECTITDIDYSIIIDKYSFSRIDIFDSFFAKYDYLPEAYRNVVCDMYREKTELRGVAGREIYYDKIKNQVNSLYGMAAQQPLKATVKYSKTGYYIQPDDYEARLKRHNKKAWASYAWGVWVTAHARAELQKMIDVAGDGVHTKSVFIYADTDSVKYIGDITAGLAAYNDAQKSLSKSHGGYAVDPAGNTHYLGVYEIEGKYDRFITWGAKRYAVKKRGRIEVTCSGVVRRGDGCDNLGGVELSEMGGLEAFAPGVKFIKAGGKEARYKDNLNMIVNVDGRDLRITDCVSIVDSEYTLSLAGEYDWLLTHGEHALQLIREWIRENDISKQIITDV